ncbi:hypothetical protein DFH09DRAFT_1127363 [Mycena vulgaris]|nr:hypothetical protein DFH09DRAFT_1127363 [Mycena vulgaris]
MLHLPVELVISILKYLPLSIFSKLLSTSREWYNFFEENQSILYHNAAVLHGFTPSTSIVYSDLEAVRDGRDMTRNRTGLSRRSLAGVCDWKSFCYKQICIKKAWRAEGSSRVTAHRSTGTSGSNVHRIKADEQRGFVIVTSSSGGLLVVDMDKDKVLWSLPQKYVHSYAHCEYDSGYLIFDRLGGEKEVWRVADEVGMTPDSPTFAFPDEKQNNISSWAAELHDFPLTSRGHFKPWMVLKPPALTRAFRFISPTLIAASDVSFFMWDITTGELVQVMRDIQISVDGVGSTTSLGNLNYVEVSPRHAFVCGSNALRVFSRASDRCVLDIPSSQLSYGNNTYSLVADGSHERDWLPNSVLKPQPIVHRVVLPVSGGRRLIDEFIAVHVSACGSHLAALLADSRLIIIPYFERVVSGAADIRDISLDIQLGSPGSVSRYLAFENGRVAVATGTGLFVVSLDFESTQDSIDPPQVSVYRAAWFNFPVGLKSVTCLQMSATCIFLNWEDLDDIRDFEDEEVIPDINLENTFSLTLSEDRSLTHLPNGDDIIQLFEPGGIQTTSIVFSIDFAPIESS